MRVHRLTQLTVWIGGFAALVYGGFVFAAYRRASLNQDLMRSLVMMDSAGAESAIRRGADVNARVRWPSPSPWRLWLECSRCRPPSNGWPMLSQMAATSRSSMVRLLLRHGADPNVRGPRGSTPLVSEARTGGDAATLRALLAAGADVNARSPNGPNALFMAVSRSKVDCVEVLLEHGAVPGALDAVGQGLLHIAAFNHSLPTMRLLLQAGVSPDARDGQGMTALMWAAGPGAPDLRSVTDPASGDLVLPPEAYPPPDPGCIKALLTAGADPTARDHEGRTALDLAASDGARSMLRRAQAEWRRGGKGLPAVEKPINDAPGEA